MALFDSVLTGVNQRFNLGDKADDLLAALLELINGEGLGAFVERFHRANLRTLADSWVASGANAPLAQTQLRDALGAETLNKLAARADLPIEAAAPVLALMIPQVVDEMTPNGILPNSETMSGGAVSRREIAGAAPAISDDVTHNAVPVSNGGVALLRYLLPLILLAFLAGIGFYTCRPNQETRFAQPAAGSPSRVTGSDANTAGKPAPSNH
jgi:uncharacterized protein YidB (DUF937 family)